MRNRNIIIALVIVMLLSNVVFFAVGYNFAGGRTDDNVPNEQIDENTPGGQEELVEKLRLMSGVIEQFYFNDYDWDEINEHLYRELIGALGDPYSEYLSPRDIEDLQIRSGRSYGGIGVEVTMNNGRVTVVTPMEGSPGQRAGLLPGDAIIEVDGVSVEGMTLSEAVDLIRGEPESEVVLGIFREGMQEVIRVPIVRGVITTTAVEHRFIEDGLGYLKISRFTEGADDEVDAALRDLKSKGLDNLIIDLRGNPGGYLNVVVNMAQHFVPKGEIVYMENKQGERVRTYASDLENRGFEVVVLIDEYSASASEILAGALKDSDSAILVGQNTFGKGSVQTLLDLRDGSAAKLTVQKYFTPSGVVIDGVGVAPHVEVEQPKEANFSNFVYKGQLEEGSTGLDVVILNRIMYYLGYGEDIEDTLYTQSTLEAVSKFQRVNGLPVTGKVDIRTGERVNQQFAKLQSERDIQLQKAIEVIKSGN